MAVSRRGMLQVAAGLGVATAAVRGAGAVELPAGPSRGWTAGDDAGFSAKLETLRRYVEEHRRANGLPGLTLVVVGPKGQRGFITSGWANVDRREPVAAQHLFQIGSISKSLTSLAVFKAVERGRLKLSDDIRDVLPGVKIDTPERVTLQHLVNHSSGLADDPPMFPRPTNGALWLGYKPGSHWSYSNTGYGMLGETLQALEGDTFETIVERDVMRPLGMTSAHGAIRQEDRPLYATGYTLYQRGLAFAQAPRLSECQWLDVTFSAGSVAATATDMGRYIDWLIRAGRGQGAPLLSDQMAKAWTSPTVNAPGWGAPTAKYANGWAVVKVGDRTMLHHTGGMVCFSSSIHVDAQAQVGCFASANIGSSGYRPRDITAFACQLFGAKPDAKPKPVSTGIDKAADYSGRFTDKAGAVIELKAQGKTLTLVSDGREMPLDPAGEDAFSTPHPRFSRHGFVVERKGGKAVAVWWGDHEYASDPAHLRGPADPQLAALAGRYDNDDPWAGSFRVVARPTGLFLDPATKLTRLADGAWRLGDDDWSPERIWFDAPLAGRPQRMSLSGLDFMRRADRV